MEASSVRRAPFGAHRRLYSRLLLLLTVFSLLTLSYPSLTPTVSANPVGVKSPSAIPAPVQVSPSNNSNTTSATYPPLGVPTFVWQASPISSTLYYELQVSTDPGFGTNVYDITTLATNHTPTISADMSLFPNQGTTYWRVRACDAGCVNGTWSSPPWSFHRSWTDQVALQSPGASPSPTPFLEHPDFSWSPVPGARFYHFRITADSACSSAVPGYDFITSEVEYNIAQRLSPGTYYWCVFPQDYAGRDGLISQIRSFTITSIDVPTLLAPNDGVQLEFTPQMSWTAVKGANRYHLQYSSSQNFQGQVYDVDTDYTSFTPLQMLSNNTNWYWHVAAYDEHNVLGSYQTRRSFRITWDFQAQLLTPTNLYANVTYAFFQWTGVPDAREYELQIARSPSFNPLVVDVFTPACSYIVTPPTVDGAPYYWRVIPYGTNRTIAGVPSQVFSFQYAPPSPAQFYPPYAFNPNPNFDRPLTTSVALPLFQWQTVIGASSYQFSLATDVNMTNIVLAANTSQPNFSPNLSDNSGSGFTFDPNTIYYWQVQGKNGGSNVGAPSQVWAVRINPALDTTPPSPLPSNWLQTPVDLQDYVAMDPVFRWYPVSNATKYTFQIATDSNFSNIVQTLDTTTDGTALRQTLSPELYYWRVSAYNGSTLISTSQANRLHIFNDTPYDIRTGINNVSGSTVATGTVNSNPYDIHAVYTTKYTYPDRTSYRFGLGISSNISGTPLTYTIPLNLDYALGDNSASGGPNDPFHPAITFADEFRPEYIIRIPYSGTSWGTPTMQGWNQNSQSYDTPISIITAHGAFTPTTGYIELEVPTGSFLTYRGNADPNVPTGDPTLLGMEPYSVDASGALKDTVPDDSGLSSNHLGEFRSTSDHPNPAYPLNTDYGGNGQGIPDALSALFNSSLDWYIPGSTYAYGFDVQFALDRAFTSPPPGQSVYSDRIYNPADGSPAYPLVHGGIAGGPNFLPTFGRDTYYWRVRLCRSNDFCTNPGSWSRPQRFNKADLQVQAPTVTLNSGVPTFRWQRIEGAYRYELKVASDSGYSNLYDDTQTENPGYTPVIDYRQQNYYYELRASEFYYPDLNQYRFVTPIPQAPFSVSIPVPPNLHTTDTSPMPHSPTFAWDAMLQPTGQPVIQAIRYELQVSTDSSFNPPLREDLITSNLNWTAQLGGGAGYADGTYYYRVRALLSDNNANSDWTVPVTFTKQYPLVNVNSGSVQRLGSCVLQFTWPAFNVGSNPTQNSGILGYRLETASNPQFTQNHLSFDTYNASFTNFNDTGGCTYPDNQTFYWRVSMLDTYANPGPADVNTILPGCGSNPFVDISSDIFSNYILYLNCHGIVRGTDATHFSPHATATRAQFSKMVILAKGLALATPATPTFLDVPTNYWAYGYIEAAVADQIVTGYDQATCQSRGFQGACFLPNDPVSRGAIAKFIVKAWGWTITTPTTPTFIDVPVGSAFYNYVETAVAHNIVNGYTQAQCQAINAQYPCYAPNRNVARDELTKPLFRAITYP